MIRRVASVLSMWAATMVLLPNAAGATVPPDGGDTTFLRAQSEQAARDYFAANVPGGVTQVACAPPPQDVGGVQFLCYAVDTSGQVVVVQATVDDYGTPSMAPLSAGALTASTAPPADDATTQTLQGSGSQTVAVEPIVGTTLIAVNSTGSGPFSVQPQQASAAVGPPTVDATGPLTGRYLVGLAGPFSSFAVVADGDWTIRVQRLSSAIAVSAATPATGVQPDVVSYTDAAEVPMTLDAQGTGPLTVTAVSGAGVVTLLSQAGPFTGPITAPAGPAFLSIDSAGPWTLVASAAPVSTTAAPASTAPTSTSSTSSVP